jgi:hypothetical protein
MQTDATTKVLLAIIALALVIIAVRPQEVVAHAQTENYAKELVKVIREVKDEGIQVKNTPAGSLEIEQDTGDVWEFKVRN